MPYPSDARCDKDDGFLSVGRFFKTWVKPTHCDQNKGSINRSHQNHSIGTCSVDLYLLYLFETSGTARINGSVDMQMALNAWLVSGKCWPPSALG